MTNVQELLGKTTSVGVWNLVPDSSTIGFKGRSMSGSYP